MIIYKTVQKVISQDSQQKMQFLEYKTTLKEKRKDTKGMKRCKRTMFVPRNLKTSIKNRELVNKTQTSGNYA